MTYAASLMPSILMAYVCLHVQAMQPLDTTTCCVLQPQTYDKLHKHVVFSAALTTCQLHSPSLRTPQIKIVDA